MKTLYDAHTYLGHWPFRQIIDNTADTLRAKLEKHGIAKALTANLNSVFYKDSHSGNRELAQWIAPHKDFFSGVAILNPTYAAWERDLVQCVEEFSFKALRLVPQYHNYDINSAECAAICEKAVELDIPVMISAALVDIRQCHWMDTQHAIDLDSMLNLAKKVDKLKVVCTYVPTNDAIADKVLESGVAERMFFDCRGASAFGQGIAKAVKKLGAKQFFFGSNAPMREITPSILKLQCADITESERETIACGSFLFK